MTSQSKIITLFLVFILMFFIMGNNLGPTLRSETVTLVMNMLETFFCVHLYVVLGFREKFEHQINMKIKKHLKCMSLYHFKSPLMKSLAC